MRIKEDDLLVLDWGGVDQLCLAHSERKLAFLAFVKVKEVGEQKLRVVSDTSVVKRNGKLVEAGTPFYVRRNDVRSVAPHMAILSSMVQYECPSWKKASATISCLGEEPHRVYLSTDGEVELRDHRPEHFAISAISGETSPCEMFRLSIEAHLVSPCDLWADHSQAFLRKVESVSAWFASELLRTFRFEGYDSSRRALVGKLPEDLIDAAVERAKNAAFQVGRCMACMHANPNRPGRVYQAVVALSDAWGNTRLVHRELSNSAMLMLQSKDAWDCVSSGWETRTSCGVYPRPIHEPFFWTFCPFEGASVLWALVNLVESRVGRYCDTPIVRMIMAHRRRYFGERASFPPILGR